MTSLFDVESIGDIYILKRDHNVEVHSNESLLDRLTHFMSHGGVDVYWEVERWNPVESRRSGAPTIVFVFDSDWSIDRVEMAPE